MHQTVGCILAAIMFGRELRTPVELLLQTAPGEDKKEQGQCVFIINWMDLTHCSAWQHIQEELKGQKWQYNV